MRFSANMRAIHQSLAHTRNVLGRASLVPWLAASGLWCAARVEAQGVELVNIELRPGVTCLQEPLLRQELMNWSSEPALPGGQRIIVQGSVLDPRSVVVRLYAADDEVARRSFTPGPERCEDLHGAVALAIALMMKLADAAPDPGSRREEPAPAPARERTPPRPTRSDLAAPARALSVRAAGLFAVGGQAASGFRTELAVPIVPALELRAGLLGLFSFARALADSGGTYKERELAGTMAACGSVSASRSLALHLCTELALGRRHVEGANFEPPLSARLPWSSAALRLELAWALGADWSLLLSGAPMFGLRRTLIVVRDEQGSIVASAAAPRFHAVLGIGLAWALSRAPER